MASYSITVGDIERAVNKSLSGTTADLVVVSSGSALRCILFNRATDTIYYRRDGTTAVAEADGTIPLPAGMPFELQISEGSTTFSIAGPSAGTRPYSVVALPRAVW